MKNKKLKKPSTKKHPQLRITYLHYILIPTILLVITVIGRLTYLSLTHDVLGTTTYLARGGSDDSGGSNSGSSNSGSSTTSGGESQTTGESGSGSSNSVTNGDPAASVSTSPTPVRVETRTMRNESENNEGTEREKIEVRTKDGETRIDIKAEGVKVRFERKGDKVIVKAEKEDGTEAVLEDKAMAEIENELQNDELQVEKSDDGGMVIKNRATKATTQFPVAINLTTKELTITTPSGKKVVTILPDKAVQALVDKNIIDRLAKDPLAGTEDKAVKLEEVNDEPVFRVEGVSEQKLLGILPVVIKRSATISARSGDVLSTKEGIIDRLLDFLSV